MASEPSVKVTVPLPIEVAPVPVVFKFNGAPTKDKLLAPVLIEEAPSPESVRAPEVPVRFKAPVVRVKPLEAVNNPAEVTVPVPVLEILPVVVTASPAVAGDKVVPTLCQ